ncbi:hypothetical protein MIND_00042900 [Mycena indigotica]|uniref:Uncharacterized protein n=1 Tax=Mycena indigotica TaxID=2126181 RepID=A0A8H6TD48_9AGAR|nr:uncharacterized protein MIND_00042900 [Mycena indigotica]KAF7315285.1 hypothetical protein MIND_00042900 [Mycena indigotica]
MTQSFTRILLQLVKRVDNKVCADCKHNDPRWAPWNLGVFLCIRCSGIHRGMGTHISKVKSVDLDTWTPEQMESIQKWGNKRANLYWELKLHDPSILDSETAVIESETTTTPQSTPDPVGWAAAAPSPPRASNSTVNRQPQPRQLLSTASSSSRPSSATHSFLSHPIFKLRRADTYGIGDPVEATLDFELDAEEVSKLHSPTSNYQLGLFCTSSTLYSPYSPSHPALPIEFPATCLITVNGRRLTNTYLKRRGFKNAKGSIAPPDLCAAGFLRIGNNSVSIEYTDSMPNHWGIATKDKRDKFYIVVQLIEAQRLMSLVNTLRETRLVPADEIRRQMVASMATNADEDIISSSFKLPLKCPISSARIIVPCRSAKCAHSQCFDAGSWYALMEQTTTWFCPICQKILDWRELIVDGLFAEILQQAPQGVDDVVLEADGSWRPYEGRFTLPSR